MPKKKALLPRPVVSRSEPAEEHESEDEEEEDDFSVQIAPGLLPAPLRLDPPGPSDPAIAPYADFLHFTQVPDVPRKLAGAQEVRGQSWPLAPPDEICRGSTNISISSSKDVALPPSIFSKQHKFTVVCYSEPDPNGDGGDANKPCSVVSVEKERDGEDDEILQGRDLEGRIIRFGDLSSKVDFCMQVRSLYKFETRIVNDTIGVFKSTKPRVCGACSLQARAELLPDLRHKYGFLFRHTIHVHGPAGCDFESKVRLADRSRVDVLAVKIGPSTSGGSSKPEVLRVLQVTHFIRVSITPIPRTSSAMPRPLPPEFRDPQHLTMDEDFFDRAELNFQDKEEEEAAYVPPPSNPPFRRPSRSEPGRFV
ncbi:hypothetical protein SELMODRAFT_415340 [Selaginella moellendorffii]|uniref:Uncharacterized protein n=1 Tax=Selaginella moellendorffii TaxID=88036 RepID=D8RVT6_SELML|nr:hypothetical protein SELMODRAFT_415340 [Selaginella moellendorffii]